MRTARVHLADLTRRIVIIWHTRGGDAPAAGETLHDVRASVRVA